MTRHPVSCHSGNCRRQHRRQPSCHLPYIYRVSFLHRSIYTRVSLTFMFRSTGWHYSGGSELIKNFVYMSKAYRRTRWHINLHCSILPAASDKTGVVWPRRELTFSLTLYFSTFWKLLRCHYFVAWTMCLMDGGTKYLEKSVQLMRTSLVRWIWPTHGWCIQQRVLLLWSYYCKNANILCKNKRLDH